MKTLQVPYILIREQARSTNASLVKRFFTWCTAQEKNRLAWLGIILSLHGCVITPLTLMVVMITGNNMILWLPVIAAITMCLVTNLAALPTKITIPVFFMSLLIDLAVIGMSVAG